MLKISKIIMLGISIIFFSCNSDQIKNEEISKVPTLDDYELISSLHNEALDYIYSKNLKSSESLTNVETVCYSINDFLVKQKKFDKKVVDNIIKQVSEIIEEFNSTLDLSIFNKYSENYFSSALIDEINYIINNQEYMEDKDLLMNYINSDLSQKRNWTNEDLKLINILINVSNNSENYWSNRQNFKSTQQLSCGSKVIISDGIGATIGTIFGGIGSIALGTFFSVASNEGCANL